MSSRSTSTPMAPVATPATTMMMVPHDKIAMRAYEKWCKRGCPPGTDMQDWFEAECELRSEMKGACATPMRR